MDPEFDYRFEEQDYFLPKSLEADMGKNLFLNNFDETYIGQINNSIEDNFSKPLNPTYIAKLAFLGLLQMNETPYKLMTLSEDNFLEDMKNDNKRFFDGPDAYTEAEQFLKGTVRKEADENFYKYISKTLDMGSLDKHELFQAALDAVIDNGFELERQDRVDVFFQKFKDIY